MQKEHDAIKKKQRTRRALGKQNTIAETESSVEGLGDKVEEISQEYIAKEIVENRR